MRAEGDALLVTCPPQALLAPLRVGAPVGADVKLCGAAVVRCRQRRGDRVAAAQVQAPAGAPQRGIEVPQGLEQEGDAVGSGESRAEQSFVEDEKRNDSSCLCRCGKRRVVADAKVAVEENDGCARLAYGGRVTDRQSGREESESERLDRNLSELLQELRVALPGVQVLFAFLLAVPFQQNFTEITAFEKNVYFVTLLCTAISTALLIAPSSYHRMTFRLQQKHELVFLANRFTIAGLAFLAIAMTGAIVLITNVLFDTTITTAVTGVAAGLTFATLWYALPLQRRLSLKKSERP